jgi:hypothetical protein
VMFSLTSFAPLTLGFRKGLQSQLERIVPCTQDTKLQHALIPHGHRLPSSNFLVASACGKRVGYWSSFALAAQVDTSIAPSMTTVRFSRSHRSDETYDYESRVLRTFGDGSRFDNPRTFLPLASTAKRLAAVPQRAKEALQHRVNIGMAGLDLI